MVGQLAEAANPTMIFEPKVFFTHNMVSEDVNAISWLPKSATELLVATEDNLMICDCRTNWTAKIVVDESSSKRISSLKFDPFDDNRFATMSKDGIRVFDLRIQRP